MGMTEYRKCSFINRSNNQPPSMFSKISTSQRWVNGVFITHSFSDAHDMSMSGGYWSGSSDSGVLRYLWVSVSG